MKHPIADLIRCAGSLHFLDEIDRPNHARAQRLFTDDVNAVQAEKLVDVLLRFLRIPVSHRHQSVD